MFSSQRSDLFSQDDYLTPATQQGQQQPPAQGGGAGAGAGGHNGGNGFLSHFAISSPSPIKKKSRSSRRGSGRAVALPAGGATIHEGDEEGEGGDLDSDGPQPPHAANPAPCKMRPPLAPVRGPAMMAMAMPIGGADDGSSSMEPSSSTGSTACSSGSSMALGSGGAGGDDNGFADFRNLGSQGQGLTQSVVDGFGSLRMNGSSPDEDGALGQGGPRQMMQPPAAMQCSQDGTCVRAYVHGLLYIHRPPRMIICTSLPQY